NFRKLLKEQMQELQIPQEFASRYVHSGFSGGEKKRLELLQLGLLEPEVAILDEPDSGLDVDGLKMLSDHLVSIQEQTGMGVLIITHYTQLLSHIEPTGVHIIKDWHLIQSGSQELAETVQKEGYEHLTIQ
ncbi:MAG: ATP-binding cassette domain-containing protein, partial [Candidatus Paceibacteria bacterium]